jgi:hypothetical protein
VVALAPPWWKVRFMRFAFVLLLLASGLVHAGPLHSTGDSFARDVSVAMGGNAEVTPKPKLLKNGVPFGNLASIGGEGVVFKIVVPPQASDLVVKTRGGSGDCDLYLRRNAHPTRDTYDASSRSFSTEERIKIPQPEEGAWYVLVDAFSAFRDVKLTATYQLAKNAVDLPQLSPGPGFYAEKAVVQIKSPTKGATIRYTTDGSEPTAASPVYEKPLRLTADTRVRARAFRGARSSPITDGAYFIVPAGTVTTLTSGQPIHHRAGMAGSGHLFKITLPADQTKLTLQSESGLGNTDLFAQAGTPPTPKIYSHKSDRHGNRALITIENPAAGDWFVLLRGRTDYTNVSLLANARPEGVDLIAWQPALDPYLSVETFRDRDCEVQEGMITAGTHTLLRFNTETRNIGGDDLVMPDPQNNPDFEYADCHGHYHFLGFAKYRLLDAQGVEVASGRKVSFCLLDLSRWDPGANPQPIYDCSEQGIQAGWADIYDAGLPGQWIEVDNVPNGTYTLEVTMNADHLIAESDYTNNTATIQVVIARP